jgi:hypothetical protein
MIGRSSSTRTIIAAALALGLPLSAQAETTPTPLSGIQSAAPQTADQTQPFAQLKKARETLDTLPATGATASALIDLRRDFESLQSLYLAQNPAAGVPATSARATDTDSVGGGAAGAVGTAGTAGARAAGTPGTTGSAPATDWRIQYALVNSDIATLMAPTNTNGGDGTLATSLQELRTRLEKFYTLTLGPPSAAVASGNAATQSPSTVTPRAPEAPAPAKPNAQANMLLQRMQLLLARQHSDDGRSLKLAGKVTMDRADVDEILTEIRQLTLLLQE